MDPAAGLAHRLGDDVHERGHVVVGHLLALEHGLDREGGKLLDGLGILRGDDALLRERLDRRNLDLQPSVHTRLVGPNRAYFRSGVALDQAPRMRAASTAALRALSTPTHATGTPGGICATDRSASRPFMTPVFAASGTPMTGSSVWAATTPGSAADRPAPAMITRRPRERASFAYAATRSGERWALITWISNEMPRSSSSPLAFSITARS